jgi:cytochrome b561
MVRSFARRALPVVAALFVAGGLLQVFFAGLGVFDATNGFVTHRSFGFLIGWFTLVMLVLALLGREPRAIVGLCVLVLVQFSLQSVFVEMRKDNPEIAALHPVNGFLIILVSLWIARLSWIVRREPAPSGAPAADAVVAPTPGVG